MALSAFEALQEMKKKGNTSVPGGSQPSVSVPASTGKKSAFEALQELKKKPVAPAKEAAPAPTVPVPKPDTSILMAPKSSADVLTPAPLSNVSVAAGDEAFKPLLSNAKALGNLVHDYVKKQRAEATGPASKAGAAIVDVALETAKEALYRKPKAVLQSKTKAGVAATGLDAGLNLVTMGAEDFAMGATPDIAGSFVETFLGKVPGLKETGVASRVGDVAKGATQYGMEFIFQKVLFEGVGGVAVKGYEAVTGTELTEVERNAVKSIATLGTMVAGFKAAQTGLAANGMRIEASRSASELVAPAGQSIGIDIKLDSKGRATAPSESAIIAAHKAALDKAATKNGPYMRAEMDAADVARQMLMDYRKMGPLSFDVEWRETFEKGMQLADKIEENANNAKMEGQVMQQAAIIDEIKNAPATKETRKLTESLSEAGQFAFEQELVDMAAKNDPKLQKTAAKDGLAYERVDTPDDARPAFFDVLTNKITLNETAIRKTLDRVWGGEVLKVGEGRTTTVFRKGANETFESLKNRYEKTLVEHELSHAKTITPEDVARLRSAMGDETKLNQIRKELEDRANEYSFQKANDLDNKTNAEIDAAVTKIQEGLRVRDSLKSQKFDDAPKEKAYQEFRNQKRRGKPAAEQPEFQARYAAERKILDKYKTARAAQQKIAPDAKASPSVLKAVRSEMRMQRKVDKLEGEVSKGESKLFKERVVRRLEQSVLKEKAAKVQAEMRAKFNNKAEAQQLLTDFMREQRVPLEVRGRFMTDLKNAKTPEQAEGVIREIKSEYNKYSRQETVKKITDLLNKSKMKRGKTGKNEGKMTAGAQAKLDFVRKIAKDSRNSLNQKIVELEAEARAKMAKDGDFGLYLPDDVAAKIELLELGGLKEQTLTQLNRTMAVIKEIKGEGTAERQEFLARKKESTERFIASASTQLIGTPKRRKTVGSDQPVANTEGTVRSVYNSSATFDDLTRDLGGVFETAGDELSSAQHRVDALSSVEAKEMGDRLSEAYGKDWETEIVEFANRKFDLGTAKDLNELPLPISVTRGEAMHLYMKLKEVGGREAITSKDGLAYSPEIIDKVLSVLTKNDLKIADWIQEKGYVAAHAKIKPVYEQNNGVPLGNTENYAGKNRYVKGATAGGETTMSLIEDIMDAAKSNRLASTPGFTKSRVQGNLGQLKFSTNPILDFMVYQKRVNQYVETGSVVQEWNSLLADDGIRASIREKRGQSFLDALDYQVKNIERGDLDTKGQSSGYTKAMDTLGGNITSALLASPKVWAGQFSSLAGVRAEAALLPGKQSDFRKGVMNTKKNTPDILKYADVVSSRLGKTPSELASKFSGEKGKFRRGMDKVKDFLGKPLEKADSVTTMRAASGIFEMQKNHYLDKGFDIEKAKTLAGRDVNGIITRTQSTRHFIGKSQLETGYLKYFVQLKQQPTKIFRGNIEAGKLWRRGRISSKQYASYLVWNNVVQGAAYVALRAVPGALQGKGLVLAYKAIGNASKAEEEESKMKEKYSAKGIAADAALNGFTNLTSFPIVGDIMSTLVQNSMFGKNYEFRPSIMTALTEDVYGAIKKISEGKIDEGGVKAIRAITRGIGMGDPLGIINFISDVLADGNKKESEAESKTPAAKAQAKTRAQAAKTEKARREARIRQIESE